MFYPVESLRRGGRFYLCWVADSWPLRFATITHRQLWSHDIREICNDLLEVMRNESGRAINRFSLRLSSQLLRGLVRLYQRKVTVFVGDLCMINAHVMKSTHKKSNYEKSEPIIQRSELPRLIMEMQPDEVAVEEKIQNSGNIVAHIEDITLREPTLAENRILLDDGFGELNPDQPIQRMFEERSVEMMLFKETSVQHSALYMPHDFSADKSHDKSRLNPREAQMERLSEFDISVFGKSMGEGMVLGDIEKEMPEIPDLPPPDPPQTDKELDKDEHNDNEIQKSKQITPDKIVLEELEEEPQVKRRKIRNKPIIDKKIKLSSDYIRSRIDNNNVETRPEVVIALAPPPSSTGRPLGAALAVLHRNKLERLHARTQGIGNTARASWASATEETVLRKSRHSDMKTIVEKVDEEMETILEKYERNLELQDVPPQIDSTYANIPGASEIIIQELADLPTQKLLEISHAEKRVSEEQRSPKRRRSGYVSFRHNHLKSLESSTPEVHKEIIPRDRDLSVRLTALLQRDGLADSDARGERGGREGGGSHASETPLGSLDRTKVSLGESDHTTDSKKFIRDEWGTQGVMHKIYRCIRVGVSPLDVERLVAAGPVPSGLRQVIAAKCFTSILKLKQHRFIRIIKDSETYEIKDIALGTAIVGDQ